MRSLRVSGHARAARVLLSLCALCLLATGARAQLIPIPGCPFSSSVGAANILLSPDERFLFVTDGWGPAISTMAVASDGSLSEISVNTGIPGSWAKGMVTDPEGRFLYVVWLRYGSPKSLSTYRIDPDNGSLTLLDSVDTSPGSAKYGIVYVRRPGGDFIYINDDMDPGWGLNTVTPYSVDKDSGLPTPLPPVSTGAYSRRNEEGLYRNGQSLVADPDKGLLFAANVHDDWSLNTISVFLIGDDGSLTLAPGSPFPIYYYLYAGLTGSLAYDQRTGYLYASGKYGQLVRLTVDPYGSLAYDSGTWWSSSSPYIEEAPGLSINPNGFLVLACKDGYEIGAIDLATMQPVEGFPCRDYGANYGIVRFNAAGNLLFTSGGGSLSVYNVYLPPLYHAPSVYTWPGWVDAEVGDPVTLWAHVEDVDGDALTVRWEVDFTDVQTDTVPAGGPPTVADVPITGYPPLGFHFVICHVSDGMMERVSYSYINVMDTRPPALSVTATPRLWPADAALKNVGLSVSATDADPNPTVEVAVYSDENETDPTGGAIYSPDAKSIAAQTLRLRAERKSTSNGRVYLIVVKARDWVGNQSLACVPVVVPLHNNQSSIQAVEWEAAQARAACLANGGSPPPGFQVIGTGPVIGKKQ